MSFACLTQLLALITMSEAAVVAPTEPAATAPAPAVSAPARPPRPRLPAEAFALDRKPRLRATQAWTRSRRGSAPSWERAHPDAHFSRFLQLARPSFHPPKVRDLDAAEWRIQLFRFAAAMIADLRELVTAACPAGRCTSELVAMAQRLGKFVSEQPRDFTFTVLPQAPDPTLGTWYGWQLAGGGLTFSVGCYDVAGSPQVLCRLEVPLDDGLVLGFCPEHTDDRRLPELTLDAGDDGRRVGEIELERTYEGAPVVILGGRALARPPQAPVPDKPAPAGYDATVDKR